MQRIEETSQFLKAKDVMKIMGVSQTQAYRIIKKLNDELAEKGYIISRGKVSRRYFEEKVYV